MLRLLVVNSRHVLFDLCVSENIAFSACLFEYCMFSPKAVSSLLEALEESVLSP